jgi:para-nitrobenzyl esterase
MNLQNKIGKSDVYMYYFTREVPFGEGQKPYAAFHSGELFYAYNNLKSSTVRPWNVVDYKLADVMSMYWVNFAKNGNPNGNGLPEWLPCKPENYFTMFLGDKQEIKTIPNLEKLQFLKKYFESQSGKMN